MFLFYCGKSLLDAYFLGPYWSVHKRKFLTWLISGLKVVLVDACGVSARMGRVLVMLS